MISVYNETYGSWKLEKVNNSITRFQKTKAYNDKSGESQKRTVSIITYNRLFDNIQKMEETIENIKGTKQPVEVFDRPTAIIFNQKEFNPFITERETYQKNILLASLFLKGRKIIALKNDDMFFLEFFLLGAEFSFIATFNNPKARMTIVLLDEATNTTETYKFTQKDGKICVVKTKGVHDKARQSDLSLKIFRPARPTHVVLVQDCDMAVAKQKIDETSHKLVSIASGTSNQAIRKLVNENYRAATLFTLSYGSPEYVEKCKGIVEDMKRKFHTVYTLDDNGKVFKRKL